MKVVYTCPLVNADSMASSERVKQYLSYWFQLGKRLVVNKGQSTLLPQPVYQGDRYSPEFEACWQQVSTPGCEDCHLEGTTQTIQELLSSAWEILPCARCDMPVPIPNLGVSTSECPCFDLPSWPNTELPQPRSPVESRTGLSNIHSRLLSTNQKNKSDDSN